MSIALDQGQMDKALAAAAVKDDAERVEMWISRGACPNFEVDRHGKTVAMMICSRPGDEARRILRALVKGGLKLDTENDDGQSIVDIAAINGHRELLEDLIMEHKVNPNRVGSAHMSPCMWALNSKQLGSLFVLHRLGADLNFISNGETPLTYFVRKGDVWAVKALVDCASIDAVNLDLENSLGDTALIIAARETEAFRPTISVLEVLASSPNCSVDRTNRWGVNAVMVASKCGKLKNIRALISAGGSAGVVNPLSKWTALHYAVDGAQMDVVKYLISRRVDLSPLSIDGYTPLDVARDRMFSAIESVLIDSGAAYGPSALSGDDVPMVKAYSSGSLDFHRKRGRQCCDCRVS